MLRRIGCVLVCALLGTPAVALAQQMAEQRGDIAVGYSTMWEPGLTLPVGFTLNDGYKVAPSVDLISEVQWNHGTLANGLFTANIWGFMGGVRGSGGTRYGKGVSAFGQIMAGLVHINDTVLIDSVDVNALGIEPGFGAEIAVTPTFAIRPQFDVLFSHFSGTWYHDSRFAVSAVFRLFKTPGQG